MRTPYALVFVLAAAACAPVPSPTPVEDVVISDDVDTLFDFAPLIYALDPIVDQLHSPYVVGGSFTMQVFPVTSSYTLTSSDPTVMTVVPSSDGTSEFTVHAVGPGQTTLQVLEAGGSVVHEAPVAVARPDLIEFFPHVPVFLGLTPPPVVSAKVLTGGTETFLVRYFVGSTELFGRGAITATSDATVTTKIVEDMVLEQRDWLQVTPQAGAPSTTTVNVLVGGEPGTTLTINPVDEALVDHVELEAQSTAGAFAGTSLSVVAQAFDASHGTIGGGSFTFMTQTTAPKQPCPTCAPSVGDTYLYTYDPSSPVVLNVTDGVHDASTTIYSSGGVTASTNAFLGCAYAPGHAATSAFCFALFSLGLAWARRRRTAQTIC